MAKIGLCMIVKNEAHVMRRCLDTLLPLIDFVLITDTGSTDGTQDLIRDYMKEHNLPGEVIDVPWQDFAYNRSYAMEKLREHPEIDYGFMPDADNYIVYDEDFDAASFKANLTTDLCDVKVNTGGTIHYTPILFSNKLPFRYKAVLHEYLDGPYKSRSTAQGFFSEQVQDSARNQNPNKYQDDAALLERVLETETDPFLYSRYTFYLAQSYRDAKMLEPSIEAYLKRATQGFWDEEVFVSYYMAGNLSERLGRSRGELLQHHLDAFDSCPRRAESLHAAARICRQAGKFHEAYLFAKKGASMLMPPGELFGEPWIYQYGLLDELSVAAYWVKEYQECYDISMRLLVHKDLPGAYRPRMRENARLAAEKLARRDLLDAIPAE
jgi:glycosyltransferase involved in cell wall biosynthesis